MRISEFTVKDLLDTARGMEAEIADFERALKQLREGRPNWEEGAEKDERFAVRILYQNLREKREAYVKFLQTRYQKIIEICL